MTADLLARLRAAKPHGNHHANAGLCHEAATLIETQAAEIERLQRALRLDLSVSEKLRLDIGAAIQEEHNPVSGPDYETGFNEGLTVARSAAYRVIDAALTPSGKD